MKRENFIAFILTVISAPAPCFVAHETKETNKFVSDKKHLKVFYSFDKICDEVVSCATNQGAALNDFPL